MTKESQKVWTKEKKIKKQEQAGNKSKMSEHTKFIKFWSQGERVHQNLQEQICIKEFKNIGTQILNLLEKEREKGVNLTLIINY